MDAGRSTEPISLAHQPPFRLGALQVDPSTRQVSNGQASETIEPRVMQVLVVLARSRSAVVSRDDLIKSGWGGRIVGDDAINRVLGKIRQVAAGIGANSFSIETVVKVGYRLMESGGASTLKEQEIGGAKLVGDGDRPVLTRRAALAIGGGAIIATGGALWWSSTEGGIHPDALRNFQRGLDLRGQSDPEQAEQSVAFLREAVRIEPDYAAAWGALAWGYRGLLEYGPRPDGERIEVLARVAGLRALELDANNIDAQAAILLLGSFYRRWGEIEDGCRRLLNRKPEKNSLVSFNLAWVMMEVGRFREALPIFQDLIQREAFWPLLFIRKAQVLHTIGRTEEAAQVTDDGLRRWPRHPGLWFNRMRMYTLAGQIDRALGFAADRSARPNVPQVSIDGEIILARAMGGSPHEKRAAAEQIVSRAQNPGDYIGVAMAVPQLGASELALEILQGYFFGRGQWAAIKPERLGTGFLFSSSCAPLHSHPDFIPLVREIGLAEHWRTSGKPPDFLRQS